MQLRHKAPPTTTSAPSINPKPHGKAGGRGGAAARATGGAAASNGDSKSCNGSRKPTIGSKRKRQNGHVEQNVDCSGSGGAVTGNGKLQEEELKEKEAAQLSGLAVRFELSTNELLFACYKSSALSLFIFTSAYCMC